MNNQELKRYDRQILLEELGLEGQEKLRNTAVLVIGAGGLGCPLLLYLAGAGVGKIGIIDGDVVEESNLHRQVLYQMNDLGKNKAQTAADKLRQLNPLIEVQAYPYHLSAENATATLSDYDLVMDGSDNFPTRYLVNDSCVTLNKPLIFGSIFKFEGQVSVFNYQGGPDYRSCYPEAPAAAEQNNCGESGVIGPLPGIIGSIMANECIKVICGFGDQLSGKLLIFNALNYDMQIFNIQPEGAKKDALHEAGTKAATYQEIGQEELQEWKDKEEPFLLIDVREAYEFEEYNIGGTHISLYDLKDKITDIPFQNKLVLCCTSGAKSRMAAKLISKTRKESLFIISLLNTNT
ncbi:HesA/MoeB/ThiF family protein [Pedobacter caeni]|uniref:Molybdopterin-synthase adenylyltransferase n=1 Tax=Pedobacter caeni TaxID=288992 RepID=A0A1M5JCW5_9SPHI|nr:HesA/MoeB/ThiF family protein [Pedobacter caeni]SHG38139.1 adenylyltransferase and sulfurtransferase [Pedobacter caeni]